MSGRKIIDNPEPPPVHVGMKGDRVWISLSLLIGAIGMAVSGFWYYTNTRQEIASLSRDVQALTRITWSRADMRELEHERHNGPLAQDAVDEVWRKMRDDK